MSDIKDLRISIDKIDKEMAALFEKRMDIVRGVAEYKKNTGTAVEDKTRENKIVENSSKNIKCAEYLPYYTDFIKSNMRISKAYQKRLLSGMTVAISGSQGAFADITANKALPHANNEFFSDFADAYDAVVNGECDCAFLPLENSFGGDVGTVLDLMYFGNLYITGIYESNIIQNLLGVEGADEDTVKTVLSHPQGLLQCADFIKSNGYETKKTNSTSEAAEIVAKSKDISLAAIASSEAASKTGLKIIKSHINEQYGNTTRFVVLSKAKTEPQNSDNRFVLMFTVKNSAGALSKAISVIGNYGFNLLSLKSRPTKLENWKHYFYIEGEGNISSKEGVDMLDSLKNCCENLKLLGSFEKEVKV